MDLKDLLTKKNIIALSLLVVTLIAIPAGAFLAQRTQIFKPRADAAVLSVPGKAAGQAYANGETVNVQTTGSGNIGMAIYKGIDSPSKKWNPDNPAASGKTAADIEFKSGNGGASMTGVVPFYLEYTVGSVTYGRAFESVAPVTTLTITDTTNNQTVAAAGPFVSGRSYKLKFEAADNLAEGAGSVVIEGDPNKKGILRVDATGLSNASTKAEALAKNNGADWLAAAKEVVRNNVLEFNLTAPFYLEYTSRDLNHNQEATKTLAATASGGSSGGSGGTTAGASADCQLGQTPATLQVGQTGSFFASFTAKTKTGSDVPGGPYGNIQIYKSDGTLVADLASWSQRASLQATFTPTAAGEYKVACRAGNGDNKECRGTGIPISDVPESSRATCSEGSVKTLTVTAAATANCSVTGPATLAIGATGTYTGSFSASPKGPFSEIDVFKLNASGTVITNPDWGGGSVPGVSGELKFLPKDSAGNYIAKTSGSITFAPTEAGVYRVACRATNGVALECRGGGINASTPFISCGQSSALSVTVTGSGGPTNTPTITLSPSPSTSASPTISLSPSSAPNQIKLTLSVDKPEKRVGEVVEIPVTFQTLNATAQVRIIDFTIKFDQTKFELADATGFTPEPGTGLQSTCNTQALPLCNIQPFPAVGQIRFLTTRTAPANISLTGPFKLGTIKLKAKEQTAANTKTKVELISESVNSLTDEQLPTEKVPVELEIKDKIFTKQYRLLVLDGVLTKAVLDADTTIPTKMAAATVSEYKNADGSLEPIKVSQQSLVNAVAPATSGPKTVLVQFEDYSNPPTKTEIYFKTITLAPNPSISQASCTQSAFDNSTIVTIFGNNLGDLDKAKNSVKVANTNADITSWTKLDWSKPETIPKQIQEGTKPDTMILVNLKNKRVEEVVPIEIKTADNKTATSSCGIDTSVVSFQAIPQCRSGDFTLTNVSVKIAPIVTVISGNPGSLQPALVSDSKINIDREGNPQTFAPKLEKNKKYAMLIKAPKYLAKRLEFTATDGTFCANSEDGECKPVTLRAGDISGDNNLPDGKVNSSDYGRLIAEWILDKDASRNADINGDNRVNSVDYACLRLNFNQSDDILNAISVRTTTPSPTAALQTATGSATQSAVGQ